LPTNRFGRQPALDVLRRERWSVAAISRELDLPLLHLKAALYGYVRPAAEVRNALATKFDVDVTALFTAAALAAEYRPQKPRAKR
jgi:hypothetical protein